MNQIRTILNRPGRVALFSIIIALVIGFAGYFWFNRSISGAAKIQVQNGDTINEGFQSELHFGAQGMVKSVYIDPGQMVQKGDILAEIDASGKSSSLTKAQSAYEIAKANYEKTLNGASSPAIENARAAVDATRTNLRTVTDQQNILVANARRSYLNASLVVQPKDETGTYNNVTPPTLSGTYSLDKEGEIDFKIYASRGGYSFKTSGLDESLGIVSSVNPEPIGNTGLFIMFSSTNNIKDTEWKITIPNRASPAYLTAMNAYEAAVQTRNQAIAAAESALNQANASFNVVASSARSEDITISKAQLESAKASLMAEPAFLNFTIVAPNSGKVAEVNIKPGQLVEPDQTAIILKQ